MKNEPSLRSETELKRENSALVRRPCSSSDCPVTPGLHGALSCSRVLGEEKKNSDRKVI